VTAPLDGAAPAEDAPDTVTAVARLAHGGPSRPLDEGITESIRVISFVWRTGSRIQPVLWLDRELLN
jgi:hypothetical protein